MVFTVLCSLFLLLTTIHAQLIEGSEEKGCSFKNQQCQYTVNLAPPGTCSKETQNSTKEVVANLQQYVLKQTEFLQGVISNMDKVLASQIKDLKFKTDDFAASLLSQRAQLGDIYTKLQKWENITLSQENEILTMKSKQKANDIKVVSLEKMIQAQQVEINTLKTENRQLKADQQNLITRVANLSTCCSKSTSYHTGIEKKIKELEKKWMELNKVKPKGITCIIMKIRS